MKSARFEPWFTEFAQLIDAQALLVSDANAAYLAFADKHGLTHETVNASAGERVRPSLPGAIHLQNINGYHARLQGWLLPFRGVASRYLRNHLGWRWALDCSRVTTVEQLLAIAIRVIHS